MHVYHPDNNITTQAAQLTHTHTDVHSWAMQLEQLEVLQQIEQQAQNTIIVQTGLEEGHQLSSECCNLNIKIACNMIQTSQTG